MASSMKKVYKLMPNSNRKANTCSAYGCDMRSGTNAFSEIKMFTFPRNADKRRKWEIASRTNCKSKHRSLICSKHFISGRPSSNPNDPDYVPSIFEFNENAQNLKSLSQRKRTIKKILETESCGNPTCRNSSSHGGTGIATNCGIKGFCNKCFSTESVSSAFSQSLEPLNQTLGEMMFKMMDMEVEREQLRIELAQCRGEIHQLREAHQQCMVPPQTTSTHLEPNSTASASSVEVTEMLQPTYSDETTDVYDPDILPSQYLEQIYYQPGKANKGKRQRKQSKITPSSEVMDISAKSQSPKQRKQSKVKPSSEVMGISDKSQSPKKKRMKSSSLRSKDTDGDKDFLKHAISSDTDGDKEFQKDAKSSDTDSPITIIYLKC